MPLSAREVRLSAVPVPRLEIPKDILEAIDAQLLPDWTALEVFNFHEPHKEGRKFVLSSEQEQWAGPLAQTYRAAGWDVTRIKNTLVFHPRALRERLINQSFPGR